MHLNINCLLFSCLPDSKQFAFDPLYSIHIISHSLTLWGRLKHFSDGFSLSQHHVITLGV